MHDRELTEWYVWMTMNQEVTNAMGGKIPLPYDLAWKAVFSPEKK